MQNFDVNKLSGEEAKAIVRNLLTPFQANIQRQQVSSEKIIEELTIDLSIERTRSNALKISFPFVSLRVEQATDIQTFCNLIPVDISDYQKSAQLKLNDSIEFDNGISGIFITHPAQAGKKMVIKFFTQGRVRSGSVVLDQGSAVSTIYVGDASAPNDGFSHIINFSGDNTVAGYRRLYANWVNDKSFFNGSYRVGVSNRIDMFKVPSGYSAEVLGAEIDSVAGVTSGGLALVPINDGQVFSAEFDLGAIPFVISVNTACPANTNYLKKFIPVGDTISRPKRIFYENEVIGGYFYSAGAVAVSVVNSFRVLVRLTKNVES